MKYVALLRGINVGGNSLIKMSELKVTIENAGFTGVSTYIASGNVLFNSDEKRTDSLVEKLESAILNRFSLPVRVTVLSQREFTEVLAGVPPEWITHTDLRKYIAFVIKPAIPADILKELSPKEDIDSVTKGNSVVYMSTLLSGITKSGLSKIATKKIYQSLTIRNYNTILKLSELMKK